jgi:DNA polymerase-1
MDRKTAVEQAKVLKALIEVNDVSKILSTFIKAFKLGFKKNDGMSYLHGNFNVGPVSGRLSSSDPNLQNIPSKGTQYAKPVKLCFRAPPGWIMVGADFSSLEDRISALTTKDPNKLKVYTDGYDGHCLRAYAYFGNQMPDIVDTVQSINSIEQFYEDLRQESKGPTFALTYGGTYHTLMDQGFSEEEAKEIEGNYHALYKVSDQWVQDKIQKATQTGYTTVAFGLRLRTPLLGKSLYGKLSYEAQAEGRTMGNAHGQSYGMLNNRAAIEFQERVLNSRFKHDILPISHIHDAQYFIIRDNIATLEFVNNNLIECMQWQELPEIAHDQVKLGGELSVFYPTWADETKLPNNATRQELFDIVAPLGVFKDAEI